MVFARCLECCEDVDDDDADCGICGGGYPYGGFEVSGLGRGNPGNWCSFAEAGGDGIDRGEITLDVVYPPIGGLGAGRCGIMPLIPLG